MPPLAAVARDLTAVGVATTAGAAPGYVEDRACAFCHAEIAASYAAKGMARAFRKPRPETDIEDFSGPPFFHAPSGQYLQIARSGDRLLFKRWQLDAAGRPINLFEQEVDWILGSGNMPAPTSTARRGASSSSSPRLVHPDPHLGHGAGLRPRGP